MTPSYFSLDCIRTPDGGLRILDVAGNVGGGLWDLAAAYGGGGAGRERLRPYLQRLGELAGGRQILFVHDPYRPRLCFPDDFFAWVQRVHLAGPMTDWVPDMPGARRSLDGRMPGIEQMGVYLDPLARRLKLRIAYAEVLRIDETADGTKLLLSGYRDRARGRPTSVILPADAVGLIVFSGVPDRFPADLLGHPEIGVVNPPLLDLFLDAPWLLPALLEGTPAAEMLPRSIPVGMALRTAQEVRAMASGLHGPDGFPIAVLKPVHRGLGPGIRFLDRTAVLSLAARQSTVRISSKLLDQVLAPRVQHSYEEVSGYSGKQLDTLLRTPGARVHDHRDGTFHYSAPYPFLEATASLLREYVESRPVRSRRTGKLHRGTLRVVMFDGTVVAAVYGLDQEADDGRFRDPSRPETARFFESAPEEDEREIEAQVRPFLDTLAHEFEGRVQSLDDLRRMRDGWLTRQAGA